MQDTLIQTQTPVNTEVERIFAQMTDCVTAHFHQFPGLTWEETFRTWQEAWSDDRGVDLMQFPIPAAPLPDVAIDEDAAFWQASVNTGIPMF